jgi:hypothetical protein
VLDGIRTSTLDAAGMTIDESWLQSLNAHSPMLVNEMRSGQFEVNCTSDASPQNADVPID